MRLDYEPCNGIKGESGYVKQSLYNRRLLLVEALARGYSLREIVPDLSLRFGCSQAAIYKDYERRASWARPFIHDNNSQIQVFLLREQLSICWRSCIEIILEDQMPKQVRLAALKLGLKILKKEIKLGFDLGIIKPKTTCQRGKRRVSKGTFNPILLQAIAEKAEHQS
jgi:hypothetical protein